MDKALGVVEKPYKGRLMASRDPAYRAVTLGNDRSEWAVVDNQGCVVFRGDARSAAMIASRLTHPVR